MKKKLFISTLMITAILTSSKIIFANKNKANSPLIIKEQGSFAVGGSVINTPGVFNATNKPTPDGQTLHGDHAYIFYQIPEKAEKYPLVFLHGAGQSSKTWESTPDGREGFQNIFLRKQYGVYLVDQPRRGKAGQSTLSMTLQATPSDQLWFNTFRIGEWPNFYAGVEFPQDKESINQFFRQMTPNTGAFDKEIISDSMSSLFDKIGEGILVTHSQGGGPGWSTAIKNNKVVGVVSYEPGEFPFPEGELPATPETTSPFPISPVGIPKEDFLKLTQIPIVLYFGDNIPSEMTNNWGQDNWRIRLNMAKEWVDTINRHGGKATLVHLPEIGIKGNTHFPFSDLNNSEVANILEKWLKETKF